MKLYLALFLIKSIGQREQHQQVLCTGRTFSSTYLVDFTSAFWRGRRWDGTFILKWNMNFITMNPRIMASTHLMVPHHVWIKRASLGSKKQKQYDQFEPHTKSQPIHKFSLSLAWFQKQYQCEIYITICIRCGAKNEVCCVSLVGSIEMKKLASGWCHVRWGPIDGRPNWIINIYIYFCRWNVCQRMGQGWPQPWRYSEMKWACPRWSSATFAKKLAILFILVGVTSLYLF